MNSANLPLKRGNIPHRRLLGEARRETAEAAHIAASKRRRLSVTFDTEGDEGGEDEDNFPTAVASGALGDDDVAVFADSVYEDDDKEADFVYEQVDKRMLSRRQKQRELVLQQQLKEYRDANPTVRQQFADLKHQLQQVSPDEWAAIPDIGDYSVKKEKFQKFTPVPDSLLERARQENAYVATDATGAAVPTDLAAIGAGRISVLEHNLDSIGGTSANAQPVDHDGYLSGITGTNISADTDIGDVKKARLLLKSITSANPKHAPGWIAAARLEEKVGKMSVARSLALEGCRKCPRDPEVWIEAARLHPPNIARGILGRAVRNVPKSLVVWLKAVELEDDDSGKRRVLHKALQIIPQSASLWQAAVDLENPSGAKNLLIRAVEAAPKAVELWLALAKLEPYPIAKQVLKRAQDQNPGNLSIIVTEAQLEEAENGQDASVVNEIIAEGMRTVGGVKRDVWLQHAKIAELAGHTGTVRAIVHHAAVLGVEDDMRESSWGEYANRYENEKLWHLARAFHELLTATFPFQVNLWQEFVAFERRRQEDPYTVKHVLEKAVEMCSQAQILWLMLAKEVWKDEGVETARQVLQRAFGIIPSADGVWVAAAKLESETGNVVRARNVLAQAREATSSARVWMKSALLERRAGDYIAERRLICTGLDTFSNHEKLWLMLAQWCERHRHPDLRSEPDPFQNGGMPEDGTHKPNNSGDLAKDGPWWKVENAHDVYELGVRNCPSSVALWIGYSRLEADTAVVKARAILDRGRESCKKSANADLLWRESIYLEMRTGERVAAFGKLARGLQQFPASGHLWALAVAMEERKGQKTRCVDAIKACPHDAMVILEVAKYIWRSGKIEKARSWLNRTVALDSDFGDGWATLLAFEKAHGSDDSVKDVIQRTQSKDPRHGDIWQTVSKQIGNEQLTTIEILLKTSCIVSKEPNITGIYT